MPRTQNLKHRADALRNREIILKAAREVFSENGVEASLSLVVERSGLGRGSLYRHFPNRFSLISAIFDENFQSLEALSRSLHGNEHKFRQVFALLIEQLIEARGFVTLLMSNGAAYLPFNDHQEHLRSLLKELIQDAHDNKELPENYTVDDLILVVSMLAGLVLHHPPAQLHQVMENTLRLVGLEGLR